MTTLALDALPPLPQCQSLTQIAPVLWQQPGVRALWLGGSLARGEADPYSDVDLRVGVTPETLAAWKSPDFTTLFQGRCLGSKFQAFAETAVLHHLLLVTGDLYDLWVQSVEHTLFEEPILVLGCRDATLARRFQQAGPSIVQPPLAESETLRQVIVEFWLNTHKHRKVLYRGLPLLVLTGLQADRAVLLRLWYVLATGLDYEGSQNIHGLTHVVRTVEHRWDAQALELLGAPLTSRTLICRTIEHLRDEVSRVGQLLAERLGFEYPHPLEQTVRRRWAEFMGLV